MSDPQQTIRQMRADVDKLAKRPDPEDTRVHILRNATNTMKLRLRKLHLGEQRRKGDLWFDGMELRPLILPWWRRYGRIDADHAEHFRPLP